jgi:hypothetical protein
VLTPLNRLGSKRFLREARQKVWHNTLELRNARIAGPDEYGRRLAELELLSAAKIADLLYGLDGFPLISVSRPLLELVVRRRVAAHPGVTTLAGRRAVSLRGRPAVGSATPRSIELDDGTSLTAHLVIDASGRTSRLPQWLDDLAASSPPSTTIDIRMGYASREYLAPAQPLPVGVAVVAATPQDPRGGMIMPIEGGRWLVTVVGAGQFRPPRDTAGFEAHLRSLRDPVLAQLAETALPAGDIHIPWRRAKRSRSGTRSRAPTNPGPAGNGGSCVRSQRSWSCPGRSPPARICAFQEITPDRPDGRRSSVPGHGNSAGWRPMAMCARRTPSRRCIN